MKNYYCAHIADILSSWGDITCRRMFSGFGLYKNGHIFALICNDSLYLKVDKQSQRLFVAKGCEQFTYDAKNKTVKMSYWSAPEVFFDSPEHARHWAEIAYQAGIRSKKPKL